MQDFNCPALYQWLLNQEQQDDDNRRFYSSYLLGHVSLAEAEFEDNPAECFKLLNSNVDAALAEDRLSDEDRAGIRALLNEGLVAQAH